VRISEVSKRTGISTTALRYYESIGLIAAARSSNGYRDYSPEVVSRLELIEASKELGLPLEVIARHLGVLETRSCTEVRDSLRPLLAEQLRRIEDRRRRLDQLQARLLSADAGLAACADRATQCMSECALSPACASPH